MEKQPGYQTADVLIFQRYDNEKDIPEGRKIAFRDKNKKPYIMRFRRRFTIDEIDIDEAKEYIGKRVFDYQDSFKRVIELLKTSSDFQMLNQDYVNCILIDSIANIDETTDSSDVSDDDLFMVFKEEGIYNRDVKIRRDEIINDNNSCYVNLIVKRFQAAFEKAANQKKYNFKLTHKSLCDICGIEFKERDMGLSVNKSLAFFKKFNLGLHVSGAFGTVFKYKPEKRNKNINPSNLFIYILNRQCYEINDNVREFERIQWEKPVEIDNIVNSMTVSDKYNIRPESTNKELPIFFDTKDEAIGYIKSYDTASVEDKIIVTIVFNDYLDELMFGIINELKYTPEIKMMCGKITALVVNHDNVIFYITLADTKANDTDV